MQCLVLLSHLPRSSAEQMLPILLALFLNFDAGQMQSDYKDILTRVITDKANAQEFPHEASVRTLESPNPKIPDVITHTINGITEGAIQGNAPGANFQVIDETSPYNVKPTEVIHIVEPPEVQFNITHETIEPKPKITNVTSLTINEITKEVKDTTPEADAHEEEPEADLPTGGSAVVTSTTTLEPITYGPEIENPIEAQPQTFEGPVSDESDNNQVTEQPGKLESKTEPDVNAVNQPINVDYQIKTMEPDVKDYKTIITDNRERISGQQKIGKPPHKSAHKNGTKKPAHVHKKHKKIAKKTIYRVNQHINVDYHIRSTSNVKIGRRIKKIHRAHKRVPSKVRRPPTPKRRVVKGCGCKLRMKRDISSHKARYGGGESGIFHANPAENVNADLRPKRDFAGRLEMPAHKKFVYSKMRYPLSRSHKSRGNHLSGETKPSDSSHDSISIAAGGSLQFDKWLKFGTCEYMVKRNARTYDSAEAACQKLDAHLVSIHSEPENNFIHKITSIGSRVESFEDFVWIGLRLNSQNQWEWVDGSLVDYQKWAVNQQNHSDGEKCAQLYQRPANLTHVQEYYWNSFRCDRPMKYYVCKRCKGSARGREHTRIDLRTVKA
ncbi:unnamed protein product [Cylicocyclus nassatus]|uniref:C-type lectin domain-containing protein n=1 Tax=Cylicocyclus nassatus TaxID=53992 RepID=A0AA36M7J6_CYLNA|nr:unnamed protein product [Cylicocyclus nassatus]